MDKEELRTKLKAELPAKYYGDAIDKTLDDCDSYSLEFISEALGNERGRDAQQASDNVYREDYARLGEQEEKDKRARSEELFKLGDMLGDFVRDSCSCGSR